MKIANVDDKPVFVRGDEVADIAAASDGDYPTMQAILDGWTAFGAWHSGLDLDALPWQPAPERGSFGPPVPRPGKIVAAGLNFGAHKHEARELLVGGDSGLPETFSKFPSSVTGPYASVELPGERCDFEVELVAVIGKYADQVAAADALDAVAGFMVGQDVSNRGLQYGSPSQLTLAKSFRTFAPTGPVFVSLDEIADLEDLQLWCEVNGERQQEASTGSMLHSVPQLVELFSAVAALRPGDLIFCGTPAGVGFRQDPPRYLKPGDVIRSEISGIGQMENTCVAATKPWPYAS